MKMKRACALATAASLAAGLAQAGSQPSGERITVRFSDEAVSAARRVRPKRVVRFVEPGKKVNGLACVRSTGSRIGAKRREQECLSVAGRSYPREAFTRGPAMTVSDVLK